MKTVLTKTGLWFLAEVCFAINGLRTGKISLDDFLLENFKTKLVQFECTCKFHFGFQEPTNFKGCKWSKSIKWKREKKLWLLFIVTNFLSRKQMEGEWKCKFWKVTGFGIFCKIIDLIKDNNHAKNLPYNINNSSPKKEELLILSLNPGIILKYFLNIFFSVKYIVLILPSWTCLTCMLVKYTVATHLKTSKSNSLQELITCIYD